MKINPPDLKKSKTYERFKQELLAWRIVTDIDKKKQGIAVALSLPQDEETQIREQVFDELDLDKLNQNDGLDELIKFLDEKLGKDDLADCLEKFEDFEDYVRDKGQSITEFIAKFDQKYNKVLKKGMQLPPEILAFKLLRRSKITKEEKMLVLTGMDYNNRASLYDQAKKSLTKFKGELVSGENKSNSASGSIAIKLEPAFLVENEEALLAAGYVHQNKLQETAFKSGGFRGRGRYTSGSRGRNWNWRGVQTPVYPNKQPQQHQGERHLNPKGTNGELLTCRACGSYRHLLRECPDSWENIAKVNIVEQNEDMVLFTGSKRENIAQLGNEARNCAILDSACTSTVCGQSWLKCYLDSLDDLDRNKVKSSDGIKIFKFGGGEKLKSLAQYNIPAMIAGEEVTIKTDVVNSDIPLLLSKEAMKNIRVKLDLEHDTAEILGKSMALNHTTSGHYCLPIDRTAEMHVENVCAVKLLDLDDKERYKTVLKLHRQFAHPPEKKLIALMKDSGAWDDELSDILKKIHSQCECMQKHLLDQ